MLKPVGWIPEYMYILHVLASIWSVKSFILLLDVIITTLTQFFLYLISTKLYGHFVVINTLQTLNVVLYTICAWIFIRAGSLFNKYTDTVLGNCEKKIKTPPPLRNALPSTHPAACNCPSCDGGSPHTLKKQISCYYHLLTTRTSKVVRWHIYTSQLLDDGKH